MGAKITAVVCTYNRYPLLKLAVKSLIEQSLPDSDYEILIVDNTPPEHRAAGEALKKECEVANNLTYLFEETPGLSNARNVALRHAACQYITYIDDDAIASEHLLERILEAFDTFDDAGVVGGSVHPIWEVPVPAWLDKSLWGHLSVVDWGGELRVAGETEWFAGANISFRTEALRKGGGFSTNLGRVGHSNILLSNEEVQVMGFLKDAGYTLIYAPEAKVDHLAPKERLVRDWFRRRVAWQAASDFMMAPDSQEALLPDHHRQLKEFIASRPPLLRNLQALYYAVDDPADFIWQLGAIYCFTSMSLAGFSGLEGLVVHA